MQFKNLFATIMVLGAAAAAPAANPDAAAEAKAELEARQATCQGYNAVCGTAPGYRCCSPMICTYGHCDYNRKA